PTQATTLPSAFSTMTLQDPTWNMDTASSSALLQQIIDSLHNEFDMTDLGALNYFLGIFADRTSTGLFLSQRKYALQLFERAHVVHCNPSRTPVDTDLNWVCIYMHDPREPHFAALKRIWRYVKGTVDFGLLLYASATTSLVGYTDTDWAGCPSTRRSTSGYCVFLGDNLLYLSAKRQHTLSRSSAEAEYRGVANVVAETAWLRNLLRELHSPLSTVTLVYCDNVSAVYMSANPVQHQQTNHIEIDIHFVCDMVTAGQIRVLHVPSRYRRDHGPKTGPNRPRPDRTETELVQNAGPRTGPKWYGPVMVGPVRFPVRPGPTKHNHRVGPRIEPKYVRSGLVGPVRSGLVDSTPPSPQRPPLTQTSPTPTPPRTFYYRSTARMAVRTQPTLSPDYSAKLTEAMTLSRPSFCKRRRSSYETPSSSLSSASSPTLPSRKRYRGTSELIADTETESDESKDEGTYSESYRAAIRPALERSGDTMPSTYKVRQSSRYTPDQQIAGETPIHTHARLPVRLTWEDPEDAAVREEILLHRCKLKNLERVQEETDITLGIVWRSILALETWAWYTHAQRAALWQSANEDRRGIYDLRRQHAIDQREMHELNDRIIALEQRIDH
nr:ribonuclease H-like domain-containing protein [Tanacetum cinerariifolium]